MKKLLLTFAVGLSVLGALTLGGCRAGVAVDPDTAAPVTMPR